MTTPAWGARHKESGKRHKFKNLPAVVATEEDTWRVEEEFNVFADGALANTTVDVGLPSGWNVGASVLNVGLWQSGAGTLWDPDILLNVEKTFALKPAWAVVVGTTNGATFWDRQRRSRVASYSYIDNQFILTSTGVLAHLGAYLASEAMTGPGDRAGFLAGLALPLGNPSIVLSAEYLSGNNALGTGTLQVYWQATLHWRINVGMQIPAPHSPNDYGALLGLDWH